MNEPNVSDVRRVILDYTYEVDGMGDDDGFERPVVSRIKKRAALDKAAEAIVVLFAPAKSKHPLHEMSCTGCR